MDVQETKEFIEKEFTDIVNRMRLLSDNNRTNIMTDLLKEMKLERPRAVHYFLANFNHNKIHLGYTVCCLGDIFNYNKNDGLFFEVEQRVLTAIDILQTRLYYEEENNRFRTGRTFEEVSGQD